MVVMPGILIKDVPSELHQKLKARAEANRRSLSSEALMILEGSLDDRAGHSTLEELDRARVRGRKPLRQSVIDGARRRDRR
jgi:plasmid stability protein